MARVTCMIRVFVCVDDELVDACMLNVYQWGCVFSIRGGGCREWWQGVDA